MARKTEGSFSELFMDNVGESEQQQTLRINDIEPNRNQPRKTFDSEGLKSLAESISENGVIQPLIVRSMPGGGYQIVAGERRWRASKMAGLSEVPVIVRDDLTEEQTLQLAMIENLQRENLNPIEEALGYKELIDKYSMTQDRLAKAVGKARSTITNSLSLLALPKAVQDLLRDGVLSMGHCKALKQIKDEALLIEVANRAANGELSVRQVESIAKREAQNIEKEKKSRQITKRLTYYTEVEASLTEMLGTKVKIIEGRKGNSLQIKFNNKEQLEYLCKFFNN